MSKMKLPRIVCLLFLLSVLLPAQDRPRYGTGTWDAAAYGNHRAVLRVTQEAEAVYARIPWLRRDQNPDQKGLVIVDAATQKPIKNWIRLFFRTGIGHGGIVTAPFHTVDQIIDKVCLLYTSPSPRDRS